eukprot:12881979-Prorocentrum_lima.AAC.1
MAEKLRSTTAKKNNSRRWWHTCYTLQGTNSDRMASATKTKIRQQTGCEMTGRHAVSAPP